MPKSEAGTRCGREPGRRRAHTPLQTPPGCLVPAGTFGSCTPGLTSQGWHPQNPCLDLGLIPTASCPGSIRPLLSGHKASVPAGCWVGGRGWTPTCRSIRPRAVSPAPGTGATLHPAWEAGPVGARGAHRRCRRARDSSGLAGRQAPGLAQTNRSPSAQLPGPRGSSEQPLRSRSRPPPAQAREHVRPPQPTSPAALPALAEGGLPAAAAWQLGSSPPKHSQIPEVGGFSRPCSCIDPCTVPEASVLPPLPRRTPCSVPAWWVQLSLTVPSRAGFSSRCHALPTLPVGLAAAVGSRESLLGCSACASLEGAQERGCSLRYRQTSSAFPHCSHRELRICRRALGGRGPAAPVPPEPRNLPAGRHRAAGPPRTHPAAPGHHAGPPRVRQGAAEAWRRRGQGEPQRLDR